MATLAIVSVTGRVSPVRRINDTGSEPPCLPKPRAIPHGAALVRRGGLRSAQLGLSLGGLMGLQLAKAGSSVWAAEDDDGAATC